MLRSPASARKSMESLPSRCPRRSARAVSRRRDLVADPCVGSLPPPDLSSRGGLSSGPRGRGCATIATGSVGAGVWPPQGEGRRRSQAGAPASRPRLGASGRRGGRCGGRGFGEESRRKEAAVGCSGVWGLGFVAII
jgi:hypothetical protein